MKPEPLERRARFVVLSFVVLVAAIVGNGSYQASNLCLADMTWRHSDHYKLVALQAARDYDIKAFPSLPPVATDEALRAYLADNPDCCLIGKHDYFEDVPPSNWDRISGHAAKIVSLNSGPILGAATQMIGYHYIRMDNCGAIYRPDR